MSHIEHMHGMVERLAEIAKCELDKGVENIDAQEMGAVVDMIKDLCCAIKDAKITKEMDEAKEEEELMEKLGGDSELRFYGGNRRYYDNYRYANGRFAPKGRGNYEPRRGYEEESRYYTPSPEIHNPEYWRDVDRDKGRLYYTETGGSNQQSGGSSASRAQRDSREGRSGISRRTYMETKELHSGNSPQDKEKKMHELEEYAKELSEDITSMIEGATNEERTLLKQKLTTLTQKI